MILCSVRDEKVECFLAPLAFVTVAQGVRLFQQLVNDRQSEFSKFPSDYVLFEIGTWDEKTAQVESHSVPIRVVSGELLVNKE